jgi:basic membrane lipoprotein Med (substrate-binding protein (PBP1-ABC) superfamily)
MLRETLVRGGTKIYNLKNEGVDYARTGDHIPAGIIREVEAIKADIIAGKLKVPATADEINALYPGRYTLLMLVKYGDKKD